MERVKINIISKFYIFYLWLLSKTCKISVINNAQTDINNSVIGFWHGESFPMYLLMKKWKKYNTAAVVTSDKRGDYIASLCETFGLIAFRIENGTKARHSINEIIRQGKAKQSLSICFSIDGPLGPFHEPKKMVFHIANHTEKKYFGIKTEINRKIILKSRWDKYVIPLPFSTITFKIKEFGIISKEHLRQYDNLRQNIINLMEEK